MAGQSIGILGLGYQLPTKVRLNNDPIFDALRKNNSEKEVLALFQGIVRRHVLGPDEPLVAIMAAAAEKAMIDAGVKATNVDLLIGCASLSKYIVPTDLGALHAKLGLPDRAMPLPLANDFSNFTEALLLADALIRAGRAKTILVVAGGDWTRAVDYDQGPSVSAGDGAGAAIVAGPSEAVRWSVVDQQALVRSANYGGMFVTGDLVRASGQPQNQEYSGPYFHMTREGIDEFKTFGGQAAPLPAQALMARQGLAGSDVTLIGHQASTVLLDYWQKVLKPAAVLSTIENFGNMTVASIAVTLAAREADITTPYVLLLALGLDMHAHALLLRRVGDRQRLAKAK
jgi:3-oxoacyl-[acyl-carrier-protein] synthase III